MNLPGTSRRALACLATLLLLATLASGAAQAEPWLGADTAAETWRWRVFTEVSGPVLSLGHHGQDDFVYVATSDEIFLYDGFTWLRLSTVGAPLGGPVTGIVETGGEVFVRTAKELWTIRGKVELHRVLESSRFLFARSPVGGLFVIDEAKKEHFRLEAAERIRVDQGDRSVSLPRGELNDYAISAGANPVHWLATSDGLYRRDIQKGLSWRAETRLDPRLAKRPATRLFSVRLEPIYRSRRSFRVLSESREDELWALLWDDTGEPLLARRDTTGSNEKWVVVPVGDATPAIRQLFRDGSGNYYAITDDGGLLMSADGEDWQLAATGVEGVKIVAAVLDLQGYVWFALEYTERRGGIARFDPESHRWDPIHKRAEPELSLEGQQIRSLLETSTGSVWVGTDQALYEFPRTGKVTRHSRTGGVSLRGISGIAEDKRGRVWISSTAFNGTYYFDGKRWSEYKKPGLSDHGIWRIARDRRDRLWFLPTGGDGSEYLIYRYTLPFTDRLDAFTVPHGKANDFLHAEDGAYWVATQNGLLRLALVENQKLVVKRRYTDADGLSSSRIWAVSENINDGSKWICYESSGSGVTRIRGEKISHFDTNRGLGSPMIWSIATTSSPRGWNVWLATSHGVSRYDGECWYEHSVAGRRELTTVLQLIASGKNVDSVLIGTLADGVYRFHLDDRRRPRFTEASLVPRREDADTLSFSWKGRDFKDTTPPDSLLYRHRLDDGLWSPFANENTVAFQGLEPGERSFQIEVRDLDGNTNRNPVIARFEVEAGPGVSTGLVVLLALVGICVVGVLVLALSATLGRTLRPVLRLRGAFDGLDTPVLVVDSDGQVVEYNGSGTQLLGVEEVSPRRVVGLPVALLPLFQNEDIRKALARALRGHASECRFPHGVLGEDYFIAARAVPIRKRISDPVLGVVLFIWDDTGLERRSRNREFEHRLTAIRGLSERLCAPLDETVATLRREIQRLESQTDLAARTELNHLHTALGRVEDLTRTLETFSGRGPSSERREVNATELIEQLVFPNSPGNLRLPGNVSVDFRSQPGLWRVTVSEDELGQALGEIVQNAADAMPRGGKIVIRLSNERRVVDSGNLRSGRYVEIRISDSGPGMARNQLNQIFDPFFSTKSRHQHSGAGLSVAHGIVRRHGGDIIVDSRPEKGTTVIVYIPASRAR